MSIRTAGTWAGISLAISLTGCASTGTPMGMATARPSSVPTRANPNPPGFAAKNASGPINASAWNNNPQGRAAIPIVTPTGNPLASTVPPSGSIQPVSGIAPPTSGGATLTPATPAPSSAPIQSSLLPNSPSLQNLNSPAETALKTDTNQLAANLTRSSIPSPRFEEPLSSQSPPLPVPATMEIASPTPPATNGLTVQPVLMNPQPNAVRPQNPD